MENKSELLKILLIKINGICIDRLKELLDIETFDSDRLIELPDLEIFDSDDIEELEDLLKAFTIYTKLLKYLSTNPIINEKEESSEEEDDDGNVLPKTKKKQLKNKVLKSEEDDVDELITLNRKDISEILKLLSKIYALNEFNDDDKYLIEKLKKDFLKYLEDSD